MVTVVRRPSGPPARSTGKGPVELSRPGPSLRLYNEDCLTGMPKRLAPGEVDAVVTSPPYNLGIDYTTYQDRRNPTDYLDWIERVSAEIFRVLSPAGSFFLNIGGSPQNPWTPFDVAGRLRKRFVLQNHIIWVKSVAIPDPRPSKTKDSADTSALGHYKPVNSERFLHSGFENIFHFTKDGRVPLDRLAIGVPYQDKSNVRRWRSGGKDLRCRGNTWFIPYRTIRSRRKERPHPASFPEELAAMCLRLHGTERIHRALDPFLGIGSSAAAARRLGIDFTGFEIDRDYFQTAKRRMAALGEK